MYHPLPQLEALAAYRHLAQTETLPLFHQPWWLDAAAPEGWSVAAVAHHNTIKAALPFCTRRKWGFTFLMPPPLTQHHGLWLAPSSAQKYAERLSDSMTLMSHVIAALPPYHSADFRFQPACTNWLPFYWRGFTQTTRYTYIIANIQDLDRVWDDFRRPIRRRIRQAEQDLTVQMYDAAKLNALDTNERTALMAQFERLQALVYLRQNVPMPYDLSVQRRMQNAAFTQNAAVLLTAAAGSTLHAALLIVRDADTAYAWVSGSDPTLRDSGAETLLVWAGLRYAATQWGVQHFDFEGSMLPAVEPVRRAFGAVQTPYFALNHTPSRLLRLYRAW